MTNEEIKKEVLLRAQRLKEKKAKRNRRLFAGSLGLLCVALSLLLLPSLALPPTVPAPVNDTHNTAPTATQTVTTGSAAQTASTAITPSQTVTTQTDTKHSNKGTYHPPSTTVASAPLPDSTLVLDRRTVYRLATEEDYARYGIPQAVQQEDVGAYLGTVETDTDAPIYSADPALTRGKVYAYKPVADETVLVILSNGEKFVFVVSNTTVFFRD